MAAIQRDTALYYRTWRWWLILLDKVHTRHHAKTGCKDLRRIHARTLYNNMHPTRCILDTGCDHNKKSRHNRREMHIPRSKWYRRGMTSNA